VVNVLIDTAMTKRTTIIQGRYCVDLGQISYDSDSGNSDNGRELHVDVDQME
jgi:hypothetical protein